MSVQDKEITNKELCELYFGREPAEKEKFIWKCSCGIKRAQKPNSGYNNLVSHIKSRHPNYKENIASYLASKDNIHEDLATPSTSRAAPITFFTDAKCNNVYRWLQWIVMINLPLNFMEKELTRQNVKLDNICTKTFKKYMFRLVTHCETLITNVVQKAPCFSIMLDGWTANLMHFLGVFVCVPQKEKEAAPRKYLVAFAPLLDETSLDAVTHKAFLESILDFYKLPQSKLICIIGDNCNLNKRLATIMEIPLVGCRSHRLNLAVEGYMNHNLKEEIESVSKLMSKCSTLKNSGRLRLYTHLRPKTKNVTRWTSKFDMMTRYKELKPDISMMGKQIEQFALPTIQEYKINKEYPILSNLNDVTIALQKDTITLADTQRLFQHIIETYPEFDFEQYLGESAPIVASGTFEMAIIKIQNQEEDKLTADERNSVAKLLKAPDIPGKCFQTKLVLY